jgi:hypothetical protein
VPLENFFQGSQTSGLDLWIWRMRTYALRFDLTLSKMVPSVPLTSEFRNASQDCREYGRGIQNCKNNSPWVRSLSIWQTFSIYVFSSTYFWNMRKDSRRILIFLKSKAQELGKGRQWGEKKGRILERLSYCFSSHTPRTSYMGTTLPVVVSNIKCIRRSVLERVT